MSPGTVTITAKKYCGSTVGYKTASYTLIVTSANSDLLLEFGGTSYEAVITLITNGIYTSTSDLTATIVD